MTLSDIANIRLANQQISNTDFTKVSDIVSWMGAVQAQDYSMAKWALASRLPDFTDKLIEQEFNKGNFIRTHILRPTWHFVAADDIYWMLDLTAPHIKSALRAEHKRLELTEPIISKCYDIFTKSLSANKHLTREELISELTKANIKTDNNRASHIFLRAELDKIICSGVVKNNKPTFAFFENRVQTKIKLHREEALAKLAARYFQSHSPATLQDFIWWSGLPAKDARFGIEMNKSILISETINEQVYWFSNSLTIPKEKKLSVKLLPAFDEFLISYKNRSASINFENHKKTISENGIFRPIIVINGQTTGIWKRTTRKEKVLIETIFLREHSKKELNEIEKSVAKYGKFLGKEIEIIFTKYYS